MLQTGQSGERAVLRKGAFTLIEIIVAMTIIAVIAAVAVPTLRGLNNDEKIREPLTALAEMVQLVRERAMREHRPYEIIMEREGLHAIPGNRSFGKRDEFLKHLEELRTPPVITSIEREKPETVEVKKDQPVSAPGMKAAPEKKAEDSTAPAEEKPPELPWTQTISLEAGLKCQVLMWGDGEWDFIEGDRMRRWVFQGNGMASPMRVRLLTGGTELEAGFDVLTGEMTGESSKPVPTTATR